MPRKTQQEVEEQEPKTDEETKAELQAAAAKVMQKLGVSPFQPKDKQAQLIEIAEAQEEETEGDEGDDVEAPNIRPARRGREYPMHEILSYLEDPRHRPGTSRVGGDMVLPAAMNLAVSRYLEDDNIDLLEEFFDIFFQLMRSVESKGFDKTMDLGKSMLDKQFGGRQSLEF